MAPNEPAGLVVNYFLKAETKEKVAIRISTAAGDTIAVLEVGDRKLTTRATVRSAPERD